MLTSTKRKTRGRKLDKKKKKKKKENELMSIISKNNERKFNKLEIQFNNVEFSFLVISISTNFDTAVSFSCTMSLFVSLLYCLLVFPSHLFTCGCSCCSE